MVGSGHLPAIVSLVPNFVASIDPYHLFVEHIACTLRMNIKLSSGNHPEIKDLLEISNGIPLILLLVSEKGMGCSLRTCRSFSLGVRGLTKRRFLGGHRRSQVQVPKKHAEICQGTKHEHVPGVHPFAASYPDQHWG